MRKELTTPPGRYRECTAEYHSEHCPCIKCVRTDCGSCGATNEDHFQPRCIMKVWGNSEALRNPKNIQWLSYECHALKDRSTKKRLYFLKKTLRHGTTLEEYRRLLRDSEDLVFKE
jgi:hypothetical protein